MLLSAIMIMQAAVTPVNGVTDPYAGPTYRAWTARDQSQADFFRSTVINRLRSELVDYEGARFVDVRVKVLDGIPTWCGTFDARNRFGMYTGPQRFAVSIGLFETDRLKVRAACRMDGAGVSLRDESAALTFRARR